MWREYQQNLTGSGVSGPGEPKQSKQFPICCTVPPKKHSTFTSEIIHSKFEIVFVCFHRKIGSLSRSIRITVGMTRHSSLPRGQVSQIFELYILPTWKRLWRRSLREIGRKNAFFGRTTHQKHPVFRDHGKRRI
jgi:hypothetical protein